MNKIITLIFFLLAFQNQTETVEQILNKVNSISKKKDNYKLNVSYALYRGISSNDKLAEYSGELIFSKPVFYNKIDQTETILSNNYLLKVNHDEKAILFKKNNGTLTSNNLFDLHQLLQVFKPGILKETEKNWICELIPKKGINIPYASINIIVKKKSLAIVKQVMYLKNKINFSSDTNKNDMDITRLEIQIGSELKLLNTDKEKINIDKFISIRNNKVTLKNQYKQYQIIQK